MFDEEEDRSFFLLILGVLAGVLAVVGWWSMSGGSALDTVSAVAVVNEPAAYFLDVNGDSVVLSGVVATDAQREAAILRASSLFGTVQDELVIGDGLTDTVPAVIVVRGAAAQEIVDQVNEWRAEQLMERLENRLEVAAAAIATAEETISEINALFALEPIQFDTGSAAIKPESQATLDEVITILNDHPEIEVEIQGHTDNVGKPESNMELSQARAEAVMGYLVNGGVDAGRLSATGYGETQPIADNDTDEGKEQNRRIEFALR